MGLHRKPAAWDLALMPCTALWAPPHIARSQPYASSSSARTDSICRNQYMPEKTIKT